MSAKKNIITFFTLLYILLSSGIIYFQHNEMNNNMEEYSKNILTNIMVNIDKPAIFENIIKNLPKDYFFALWIKKNNLEWLPVIIDEKILTKKMLTNPNTIPDIIKVNTNNYHGKSNNYEAKIWVNKYNIDFYGKYIFILILFLLLVYFIILFFIMFFFKKIAFAENPVFTESNFNFKNGNNSSDNINEYKKLWEKNFKITDDFKKNFPFNEISELIKIGAKPEKYIKESLAVSAEFFKWTNPKMYIAQKDNFIEIVSKEVLNPSDINVPLNGKQNGVFFIPLFPYNTNGIYGYFSFEWKHDALFYLSDIMYFLKFLFSENAKFIFLNYPEIENIINVLDKKLEKHEQIFIALFETDDKEKIYSSFNFHEVEKLNNKILNKLNVLFVNDLIYQISNFLYLVIGVNFDKKVKTAEIEDWLKQNENQHYRVSSEYGDIALTFSAGITFKDGRIIQAQTFLNEAENKLKNAAIEGGNRLIK